MPARHDIFSRHCRDFLALQNEVYDLVLAAMMPGLTREQIEELKRKQQSAKVQRRSIAKLVQGEINLRVAAVLDDRRYSVLKRLWRRPRRHGRE